MIKADVAKKQAAEEEAAAKKAALAEKMDAELTAIRGMKLIARAEVVTDKVRGNAYEYLEIETKPGLLTHPESKAEGNKLAPVLVRMMPGGNGMSCPSFKYVDPADAKANPHPAYLPGTTAFSSPCTGANDEDFHRAAIRSYREAVTVVLHILQTIPGYDDEEGW